MLKKTIYWLDPILLISIFLSTAIGIGLVLAGKDSISSLIVGLLVAIITLLVDAIARIHKTENTVLSLEKLSRIISDESLGKSLLEIAQSYEAMKEYDFDHYRIIADQNIAECKEILQNIASGSVYIPAKSLFEYGGHTAVEQTQSNIKAIHAGKMDFWRSEPGEKHFQENRVAARRGVKITRIFALSNNDVKNWTDILKKQSRAGIQVFVVNPNRVVREFMILDDRILIVIELDEGRYQAERIILDPPQIQTAMEEFQLLTSFGRTLGEI